MWPLDCYVWDELGASGDVSVHLHRLPRASRLDTLEYDFVEEESKLPVRHLYSRSAPHLWNLSRTIYYRRHRTTPSSQTGQRTSPRSGTTVDIGTVNIGRL